jgi:acyl-CoA thioesterase FadM
MNLYVRLLWTALRCLFLPSISPDETLVIRRRVWLNDIDINLHMNNGRYLTVVDLSLIEFFARTGFLKAFVRQKWRPMAGGAIITFRKSLRPLQSYELKFRWLCSDGSWNYMAYEFVSGGRVHAAGLLKGGMVGSNGLVDSAEGLKALPEKWHSFANTMLQATPPEEVVAWQQAEQGIYSKALAQREAETDTDRNR